MKKITSLILCIVLTVAALTALSVAVFADEAETPAVSDITLAGYQNKNDGFDIRIVGKIANEANYREVGFVFSNGATSTECAAKYMFKTLLASDGENTYAPLTAGEDEYLFAYIIEGIEETDALTLSVKPYAVNNDNEKIYGEEKTLVKKANGQFAQETVHTHAPVHHEATAAAAASYATAWNTEYWSCEGCSKLFGDAACTTEVEADTVMAPAQKDNAVFVNSETNPYLLANAADWKAYAEAVNGGDNMSGKYLKLTADIGIEEAPVTMAIGASGNYFAGNLDGNGKNVYVNISSTSAAGAIAYLNGGTVKGLTVRGQIAYTNTETTANSAVGGIVGLITAGGGTLTDCHNYATITATDGCNAGGIVGQNNGKATITGCANYGEVKGGTLSKNTRGVGGIIGNLNQVETRIENCVNYGTVSSKGSAATTDGTGGIVGLSTKRDASILSCTNEGTVSGYRFVGGILGRVTIAAQLEGTVNKGAVSGTRDIGGIIGGTDSTSEFILNVTGATNSGTVTGTGNYVGGIIGYVSSTGSVLTNCTNTGDITGVQGVGGIIGLLNGSRTATVDNAIVTDCTISGTGSAGGVIGRIATNAAATYKNYTAPTNVTYTVGGTAKTATAGFTTTGRTDATYATPGEAFGSCAGTATNSDETTA